MATWATRMEPLVSQQDVILETLVNKPKNFIEKLTNCHSISAGYQFSQLSRSQKKAFQKQEEEMLISGLQKLISNPESVKSNPSHCAVAAKKRLRKKLEARQKST